MSQPRFLKGGGGGAATFNDDSDIHYPIHFVWLTMCLALAWIAFLRFLRRRRPRAIGDGFFVLDEWGPRIRMCVSFAWVFLALVPVSLFSIAWIFGLLMAAFESWNAYDGFYYVVANVLGLFNALTDANPTTVMGSVLDVVISIYAMIATQMIVGGVTMLQFVEFHADGVPDTNLALLRYLGLYIPLFLFIFGWLVGGITAGVEDWSWFDGFLHMTGTLCGIANPIDAETVDSKFGMFAESLCSCFNLGIVAMVLQVVSKHPFFAIGCARLEGTYQNYYANREEVVNEYNEHEFDWGPQKLETKKSQAECQLTLMKHNSKCDSSHVDLYVKFLEESVKRLTKENEAFRAVDASQLVAALTQKHEASKAASTPEVEEHGAVNGTCVPLNAPDHASLRDAGRVVP